MRYSTAIAEPPDGIAPIPDTLESLEKNRSLVSEVAPNGVRIYRVQVDPNDPEDPEPEEGPAFAIPEDHPMFNFPELLNVVCYDPPEELRKHCHQHLTLITRAMGEIITTYPK